MTERKQCSEGKQQENSGIGRHGSTALFAGSLAVFSVMVLLVLTQNGTIIDEPVCSAVYALRREWLTPIMVGITYLGDWQVISGLCILFLILQRTRQEWGYPLAISAVTTTILNRILKHLVQRPRPEEALHLILQGGYSFPSGHSASSFAFYAMLIYLINVYVENKRTAAILTAMLSVIIFLIGTSRIYLGVHYPTDVLGGWSEGMVVVLIISWVRLQALLSIKSRNIDN